MPTSWEAYALRYATLPGRRRQENFIFPVENPDAPMPMDYYVWLLRGPSGDWLVDTGFSEAAARARRRTWLRCPIEALRAFGIAAADVREVIVTHLHYDHAGNLGLLPNARLHLQASEMSFATGACMAHAALRQAYDADDIALAVRRSHAGRIVFHDGDVELADGLKLLHLGGHTAGLQAVRVYTARGWIVLASDACHYLANMGDGVPFPIVLDVGRMAQGWRRLREQADGPDHVIPGHDPQVLKRFASHAEDIVRLHEPPVKELP